MRSAPKTNNTKLVVSNAKAATPAPVVEAPASAADPAGM